jgi:hypothetical protein
VKKVYYTLLIMILLSCPILLASCDAITAQNIPNTGSIPGINGGPGMKGGPGINGVPGTRGAPRTRGSAGNTIK